MIYDETIFGVRVWVHTGPDGLFVAGVHIFEINVEEVACEPEEPEEVCEELVFGSKTDAVFTNTFIREVDGSDPDYTGLIVSKAVAGEMASETTDFTFTATLTSAAFSTRPSDEVYTAAVVNTADGSPVLVEYPADSGTYIPLVVNFVPGEPTTFTLRHGQSLRFDYLPVGTGFRVIESNYAPYTPSIELIVDGTPSTVNGPDTGAQNIGEDTNRAAYTNTFNTTPITGLIAENLPFILVGIATIGFFAVVVAGKKRSAYE